MANRALFQNKPTASAKAQTPSISNQAGAPAYAFEPKHALAQLAVTGCMNQTFYASAEAQLSEVIARCLEVPSEFVAKTAVYGRESGNMKDMPALLMAYLAAFDGALCEAVFERVIDNGKVIESKAYRANHQCYQSAKRKRQFPTDLPATEVHESAPSKKYCNT